MSSDSRPSVAEEDARPLQSFCGAAHIVCEQLKILCELEADRGIAPDLELDQLIESALRRTIKPEVRILLIGPLKSGKSTMMEVLLQNQSLSQISPYPAYPCFVEVRDLRRDAQGKPLEGEHALLHRADGTSERIDSLAECQRKLDALLDAFMEAGVEARVEFPRVEQRVDLPNRSADLDQVDTVVVDSQGLFFSSRAELAYSQVADELNRGTDVVIFLMRWEQLFFHFVVDYLNGFLEQVEANRSLRIFLIVNAASLTQIQDRGGFRTADQVSDSSALRAYFERHIAAAGLLAALAAPEEERRVSLHFCNLLDCALSMFQPDVDRDEASTRQSLATIEEIRSYLFQNPDLVAEKIAGLRLLMQSIRDRCVSRTQRALGVGASRIAQARAGRALATTRLAELAPLQASLQSRSRELAAIRTSLVDLRAAVTARQWENPSVPDAIKRFGALKTRVVDSRICAGEYTASAQRVCNALVGRWARGYLGDTTLANLAAKLWTTPDQVADTDLTTLAALHVRAVARTVDDVMEKAQAEAADDQELADVLGDVSLAAIRAGATKDGSRQDIVDCRRPLKLAGGFLKRGWANLTSGFDFWGTSGEKLIDDMYLRKNIQHFYARVWEEDWRVADSFEGECLKRPVWLSVENEAVQVWTKALGRRLDEAAVEEHRVDQEVAAYASEAVALREEAMNHDAVVTREIEAAEGLRNQLRQLEETIIP